MIASARRTAIGFVVVALAGLATAGCGGGGSGGGASGSSNSTAGTAAGGAAPSAVAGQNFGGTSLDVSKSCAAIKSDDIQALEKAPVGAAVANPEECDFAGGAITVSIVPNDTDLSEYTQNLGTSTDISGIGDKARWLQATTGSPPWLFVHQGSATCHVEADSDAQNTTLVYSGNPPFDTMTSSALLDYVHKEAAVCLDALSVLG